MVLIVIAFATILRVQTFGLKQMLTKLIIAAVLINFSLTIAGVFIDFSHVLSDFFLGRSGNKENIGDNLANMMSIQNLLNEAGKNPPVPRDENIPLPPGVDINDVSSNFLKYLVNLVFVVVFTLLATIIFIALAFMVFVRGIYLMFLLMLMPLAWLFWAFPTLSYLWNKWWGKFLQWTFFLPAATFFVYLSIITFTTGDPVASEVLGASGGFYKTIVKLIVSVFMLLAAILVARSMGISGANVAMRGVTGLKNMAVGATKGAGRYAGRRARQLATAPARGKLGRTITEGMQKFGLKGGKLLRTATAPIRRLGGAVSTAAGVPRGEQLVKEAEDRLKGFSDQQLALRVAGLSSPEQVYALSRLAKGGNLDKVPQMARYIEDEKTKKKFEAYGKGKEYGDLEKAFGASTEMLKTASRSDAEAAEALKKAAREFEAKHSLEDYKKLQTGLVKPFDEEKRYGGIQKDIFEKIHSIRLETMSQINPGAFAKFMPKLSGKDFVGFSKDLFRVSLPETIKISGGPGQPELKYDRDIQINKLDPEKEKEFRASLDVLLDGLKKENKRLHDSISKNIGNRLTGLAFEPGEAPTPPEAT